MAQHKENDFVIPVLKTIKACQEICTTEYIKRNVHTYIELTNEDLLPYPSRNKNEPRYYQVIGNLISHRNAALFMHVDFVPVVDENGKATGRQKFLLTDSGKKYVATLNGEAQETPAPEEKFLAGNTPESPTTPNNTEELTDEFTIISPFDAKIMEYARTYGLDKRPPTDSKMVDTIIELSGYKCEYAFSIGKKHNLFIGKTKHPYLEGHHLIPMKATKDFFPLNLDRPSNLVPLCPGCHALLHHATKSEKAVVLRVIYGNHIEQLNADGIYISFEKLLEKYY